MRFSTKLECTERERVVTEKMGHFMAHLLPEPIRIMGRYPPT